MDQNLLATGFKMVVALGAVLMVFGVTMLVLKKFQVGGKLQLRGKNAAAKPLNVLAFHNLGPGRSLYLVECLGKKILVGATSHNISAISEVSDEMGDLEDTFSSSLREKMPEESGRQMKRSLTEPLNGMPRV